MRLFLVSVALFAAGSCAVNSAAEDDVVATIQIDVYGLCLPETTRQPRQVLASLDKYTGGHEEHPVRRCD